MARSLSLFRLQNLKKSFSGQLFHLHVRKGLFVKTIPLEAISRNQNSARLIQYLSTSENPGLSLAYRNNNQIESLPSNLTQELRSGDQAFKSISSKQQLIHGWDSGHQYIVLDHKAGKLFLLSPEEFIKEEQKGEHETLEVLAVIGSNQKKSFKIEYLQPARVDWMIGFLKFVALFNLIGLLGKLVVTEYVRYGTFKQYDMFGNIKER